MLRIVDSEKIKKIEIYLIFANIDSDPLYCNDTAGFTNEKVIFY